MKRGLCKCGCGETTPLAKSSGHGNVKGQPTSYLPGHARRKRHGVPLAGYEVDAETGCWNWKLKLDKRGYGNTKKDGKYMYAHRAVWELLVGPIPEGIELDHLCRNPACCNPEHLETVTPTENKRRSRATKLTAAQVAEIKAAKEPQYVLAKRFGVDPSNISHILRGASWGDVVAAA